jgi:hypothetical protein
VRFVSKWFALTILLVVLGCTGQIRTEKDQLAVLREDLRKVELSLAKATDPNEVEQWQRVQTNLQEVIQSKQDQIRNMKDEQLEDFRGYLQYGSTVLETLLSALALGGLGIRRA